MSFWFVIIKLLLILLQIKLTFARTVSHLPVASFWKCKCLELGNGLFKILKAMVHETIRNDDFRRITAMQDCCDTVSKFNNINSAFLY